MCNNIQTNVSLFLLGALASECGLPDIDPFPCCVFTLKRTLTCVRIKGTVLLWEDMAAANFDPVSLNNPVMFVWPVAATFTFDKKFIDSVNLYDQAFKIKWRWTIVKNTRHGQWLWHTHWIRSGDRAFWIFSSPPKDKGCLNITWV